MTIAKGRSNAVAELDILKDTLENMIISTESKYSDIINSLIEDMHGIENDMSITEEERKCQKSRIQKNWNKCPYKGGICNVRKRADTNYYLNDYLYTINSNYKTNCNDTLIVCTSIRDLRNYFTHGKTDINRAIKISKKLNDNGIRSISQTYGQIIIQDIGDVYQILKHCYQMLVNMEQLAKTKYKNV